MFADEALDEVIAVVMAALQPQLQRMAARRAGVKQVFIPQENWLEIFDHWEDIEVVPVESIAQVIENAVLVDVSRDSIVSGYPRTLVNC